MPLANPPKVIKGLYVTGWIAGSSRFPEIVKLVEDTELNAMVVDVKDYSGYVSYPTNVPEVKASGAENELRFTRPNAMLKNLHDKGIYAIARVSVFQDPILAKAHPEWALKNKATGELWKDRSGLHWMDPASKDVWKYVVSIAKDCFDRGFDEVNFDYMRFPSDGSLTAIGYPVWDEAKPRSAVIKEFWQYVRSELPGKTITGDIFGLTTVAEDDLGIGQLLLNTYGNFDAVAPMVYPSHYAAGFQGYKNPAQYPYEVIRHSMDLARDRFAAVHASSTKPVTLLRPWLQVFDLGAIYTPEMVKAQIKAVDDSLSGTDFYGGWLLWDPNVRYTSYKNIK
jgi:hypothetical protein